jgi:hypothetical protein
MKSLRTTFAFALLTIWSCGENTNLANEEAIYFPLKDYIEVKTQNLDSTYVVKEITINGEKERVEKIMGTEDWIRELELFTQADLNRPSLAKSYETKRSKEYLIHELKPGEKAKIQKVVVRYEDEIIKELSFHAKSENPFYQSETRGVLFNRSNTGDLDHYILDSYQKVVFMKPNRMVIRASINN